MSEIITEIHPLPPFTPDNTRLLMLGSFPPKRERWSMDFYYPNFQNDMWRIFGLVFFDNKDYFLTPDRKSFREQEIRSFLSERGIAISDSAREVIRHKDNASDKFLEVVQPVDLAGLLNQLSGCRTIVTTGQKATETLLTIATLTPPKVGEYAPFDFEGRSMRLYRVPSSSRAYPKPLHEKAVIYKNMFQELGLLG